MSFCDWLKLFKYFKDAFVSLTFFLLNRFTVSIRDILTWVSFINTCSEKVEVSDAYIHGACLTFLDSLGSGVTATERYISSKSSTISDTSLFTVPDLSKRFKSPASTF